MLKTIIKYSIAIVLAVIRIRGYKSQTFQAIAHLFVGGLFTASWLQVNTRENLILAIALSVIELGCFLWQHSF